jgi:hypothetical protein
MMSDEESRIKHSKRILKTENIIKKQTKIAKAHGVEIKEPHKLAKHHALDCGNPKCLLCHSEKVFGHKTIQEQRFDQDVEHPRDKRSNGLIIKED